MKIAIFEAYYGGSHKSWIDSLQKYSNHHFTLYDLPDRYWKWRMHGGAHSLAKKIKVNDPLPDLIIATSMVDITVLKSFLPKSWNSIPIHLYFHENQFAYKWSSIDRDHKSNRKDHYYFIQYISALAADKVFFNSKYNLDTFLEGSKKLLKSMPDLPHLETLIEIENKSTVLPLGLDWDLFDKTKEETKESKTPVIVWNHRWEEDKNPKDFFHILNQLKKRDFPFYLMVLGDGKSANTDFWLEKKNEFSQEIIHWGRVASYQDYIAKLKSADISIVTSNHDFFGLSILESTYAEVLTFLPNRLAYPEHFTKENFKEIGYEGENELIDKVLSYREFDCLKYKKDIKSYRIQDIMNLYDKTIFSY